MLISCNIYCCLQNNSELYDQRMFSYNTWNDFFKLSLFHLKLPAVSDYEDLIYQLHFLIWALKISSLFVPRSKTGVNTSVVILCLESFPKFTTLQKRLINIFPLASFNSVSQSITDDIVTLLGALYCNYTNKQG